MYQNQNLDQQFLNHYNVFTKDIIKSFKMVLPKYKIDMILDLYYSFRTIFNNYKMLID